MLDATYQPPQSLLQNPTFAAALQACGQRPVILPCGLLVLYRRVFGLPLAMLPRCKPPPDLGAQLAEVGLQRVPLLLSPERPMSLRHALRLRGPRRIASLDLTPSEPQRRARLHPKWRNQLVRAEAARLRVSHAPLPADPHHPLLLADAAQARQRGYAAWPRALTAAFAAAAPDQTRLFTAFQGRQPVAHMLFLRHGEATTYHIGHISEAGKALCAHNLLLWTAANWLADQGHLRLDLGALCSRAPGLDRFKCRTGASVQETGGTWLRWRPLAP
jgi:hypothetical protein